MKKWVTERSSKILFQEKWYTDKSAHVLEELIFHTTQGNIPIQYNSIKIPMAVFIKKHILKNSYWTKKGLEQAILRKNRAGSITLPDLKLYYKSPVIIYWHKNRHIVDQHNKTESPEIHPCPYGQLIYEKVEKTVSFREVLLGKLESYM